MKEIITQRHEDHKEGIMEKECKEKKEAVRKALEVLFSPQVEIILGHYRFTNITSLL